MDKEIRIPTGLKHKPVIVAENYSAIDGREAYGSDAKGLSLGLAQWNDRGRVDISAKVWRYTGEKWSRQSEELPLHRVLDLAIMICRAEKFFREAYRLEDICSEENELISRLDAQGDSVTMKICMENPMIREDVRLFEQALRRDDELISERLRILSEALKEL